MIREYKQQAKSLLKENFKKLFFPISVLMSINLVGYVFYNFILDYTAISIGILEEQIYIVLFLVIQIIGLSVATSWIWKRCVGVVNDTNDSSLKKYQLGDIILINFIQSFLTAVYTLIDALDTYLKTPLYITNVLPFTSLVLLVLRCYIFYKLICCNYIFFTENIPPLQAIKQSFFKINHKWFWLLKLELSFIGWDIIIALIHITVVFLLQKLGFNTINIGWFSIFGFGINFYLMPYKYLTRTLVAKRFTIEN